MQQRIARHRNRRPAQWRTMECGAQLGLALRSEATAGQCVIVDCLTLWLAGLAPAEIEAERDELVRAIEAAPAMVLIVTNELGAGVVPLGESTRAFVDEHGITNQRVAAVCERVTLMVCGVPLVVKP
jgi:adenosylcobinamide kinase/adenosylcobinamide-phosphate guanylyltransferase